MDTLEDIADRFETAAWHKPLRGEEFRAALIGALRRAQEEEREASARRVESVLANLRAVGLPLAPGVERVLEDAAISVRAGEILTPVASRPEPGIACIKGDGWRPRTTPEDR